MPSRRRAGLAWLVFLVTFPCLLGGLVVTLLVTRPLTVEPSWTAPSRAPCGCCSPSSAWS